MADLDAFSKRMLDLAVEVEANAAQAVRKVALAAESAVVLATPVDTGRARANWLVEIDRPAEGTVEPIDQSGNAAIQAAAAKVAEYVPGVSAAIHLTNNLPYIQRLNDGWSAQAPAGFVQEAVLAGVRALSSVKIVG